MFFYALEIFAFREFLRFALYGWTRSRKLALYRLNKYLCMPSTEFRQHKYIYVYIFVMTQLITIDNSANYYLIGCITLEIVLQKTTGLLLSLGSM